MILENRSDSTQDGIICFGVDDWENSIDEAVVSEVFNPPYKRATIERSPYSIDASAFTGKTLVIPHKHDIESTVKSFYWRSVRKNVLVDYLNPVDDEKSVFQILEEITPEDKKIKSKVENYLEAFEGSFQDRIKERLQFILDVQKEEFPEDWNFSVDSLDAFLTFLRLNKQVKIPDIGLTDEGFLQVQWRKSSNENLVLEFKSKVRILLVSIAPNNHTKEIATIDSVWDVIVQNKLEKWLVVDDR